MATQFTFMEVLVLDAEAACLRLCAPTSICREVTENVIARDFM